MTPEQEYFRKILLELKAAGLTERQIAEAVGVEERTVWRWKVGDRPLGLAAIRVYKLHGERCATPAA